mmetsp:Transcript_22872/g.53533  ORF Transcript_22872/g.53533 Transcript_22872/m.53533 type:complete len:818 (-) Transcript_22872:74-2527(-)
MSHLHQLRNNARAQAQLGVVGGAEELSFEHVHSMISMFGAGPVARKAGATFGDSERSDGLQATTPSGRSLTGNLVDEKDEPLKERKKWACCPHFLDGGHIGDLPLASFRVKVFLFLNTTAVKTFMAFVILCNAVQVVYECDVNQTCKHGTGKEKDEACSSIDGWLFVMNWAYLLAYTVELFLRLFVDRMRFFSDKWDVLDFWIVAVGMVTQLLGSHLPSPGIFRLFRLVRLAKALHFLKLRGELHLMVNGFVTAARAIILGSGIIAGAVILWSVAAVELLSDLNRAEDILAVYESEGCNRCPQAWESVWQASLSILSTTLMGDSWGRYALPMIERHPHTIFVFVGTSFSIVLGLTNLILAVIVDRALQQQCLEDERDLALKREQALDSARLRFVDMCRTIDVDKSGTLSREEFMLAFDHVKEFRDGLTLMGVFQKHEIEILFNIIDKDQTDAVSYEEFAAQLATIKNQDLHALSAFIKHSLMEMMYEMAAIKDYMVPKEEMQKRRPAHLSYSLISGGDDYFTRLTSNQQESRKHWGGSERESDSIDEEGSNGVINAVALEELKRLADTCKQHLDMQSHVCRKHEQWVEKSLSKIDHMFTVAAATASPTGFVDGPSPTSIKSLTPTKSPPATVKEASANVLAAVAPTGSAAAAASAGAGIRAVPEQQHGPVSPRPSPPPLFGKNLSERTLKMHPPSGISPLQLGPTNATILAAQLQEEVRTSMQTLEQKVANLLGPHLPDGRTTLDTGIVGWGGLSPLDAKCHRSDRTQSTQLPESSHGAMHGQSSRSLSAFASAFATDYSSLNVRKCPTDGRVSMPL